MSCESGFSVYMAGPGICVLCLADTCASEVHPLFNHVAHYGYLFPNTYLFIADIANPDSLFEVVGPGLVSTAPTFVRSRASHPPSPHDRLAKTNGVSVPLLGMGGYDTIRKEG